MAKLEKIVQTNNEIDPLTGLQYTQKGNKYLPIPTEAQYIAAGMSQQDYSTPMQNLAIGLPSLSKYDTNLSAEQLEYGREGPEALEEYRSEHQSAGRAALFALGKGLAKTGVNVLGGTVGVGYGLVSMIANGSLNKFYENSVIQELDSWSRGLDSAMPVYKSRLYD